MAPQSPAPVTAEPAEPEPVDAESTVSYAFEIELPEFTDYDPGRETVKVRIQPEELEGLGQLIEDSSGEALAPFYRALLRTAQKKPGAITRP